MRTPIEQNSAAAAHKWFKELWQWRTRQERLVYSKLPASSRNTEDLKQFFLWGKSAVEGLMHLSDGLFDFGHRHIRQGAFGRLGCK